MWKYEDNVIRSRNVRFYLTKIESMAIKKLRVVKNLLLMV